MKRNDESLTFCHICFDITWYDDIDSNIPLTYLSRESARETYNTSFACCVGNASFATFVAEKRGDVDDASFSYFSIQVYATSHYSLPVKRSGGKVERIVYLLFVSS